MNSNFLNKFSFLTVLSLLSISLVFGQTTIAKQSFETSGDTWIPFTLSTPACTSGDDVWDFSTGIGVISPNDGAQFWGIADLNGNCGGTGFETITFPNVDVSLFTSVTFSFDYNAFEFDNNDDLKYELFFDNVSSGEVIVVDGFSNLSTIGWQTETTSIPGGTTNLSVVLSARQNGGGDYGGFDNVILEGTPVSCGADPEPTTNATTLNFSDVQCDELTFDWTNGNGANRIVVMSTSAISGTPTDEVAYTANSVFGSGSTIAAGEFVVYNGSSNSTTVTGLALNTTYFVSIFEYNGVSANCTENYLTTSPLSGSQITLTTCAATCPQIKSILVNACGLDEGLNEYLVFQNGSTNLPINDVRIDFFSAGSYCNTSCGTNTIVNNASYVASLNATASCSKFIHVDPIPANSTVILFTSTTPSYAYDFSPLCSNGEQVVILFCNSTSTTGRFANSASTIRNTTMTWGSCTQTAGYIGASTSGNDGDFADFDATGAVSYSNNGACIASPLPVKLNYFESKLESNKIRLEWESYSEIDALDYELLKSKDGINYQHLAYINSAGNSNEIIKYSFIDEAPLDGNNYYQLNLINLDNKVDNLGYTLSYYHHNKVVINTKPNEWELFTPFTIGTIELYTINGKLINSSIINDRKTSILNAELDNGIYILKISFENEVVTKKIVKSSF